MKQLKISLLMLLIFTVLTGLVYPLVITGAGSVLFPGKTRGSLLTDNGRVRGSELIGQNFTWPGYFHGRPSAVNYDPALSGGSNMGPTNRKLLEYVKERASAARKDNRLDDKAVIPEDLLFASGSGLDPHISVESAMLQAERIASARNVEKQVIEDIIKLYSERQLPFYGKRYVNVMKMNAALDGMGVTR